MIKTINIDTLRCVCVSNIASKRVVYMIYPSVSAFTEEWLRHQADTNNCSIVMVYVAGDDWDNYLTPWAAPGVPRGSAPFKGLADEFNRTLITEVIPEAEKTMGMNDVSERDLVGVSLAGLFTLWQWVQFNTFHSIACLSGSFWYEGFIKWFIAQPAPQKIGKAFFLLGREEPQSRVKAFKSVGQNTEIIVDRLRTDGISVNFKWVTGDHFSNPTERAETALDALKF